MDFEKKFLLQDLSSEDFGSLSNRNERMKAFEAAWARKQNKAPGWPTDPVDLRFNLTLNDWLIFHKATLFGELIPRSTVEKPVFGNE